MGEPISAALDDPDIVEILLNPDGSLWFDRLGSGRAPSGVALSAADAERIIRLVASHVHVEVNAGAPVLSAQLPETRERFEGVLPPVTRSPSFSIRKRATGVISLQQHVADGILSASQATFLRLAVLERTNILIAGGTCTGKTTLVNALLQEIAVTGDRVIVLEDAVDLQCATDDQVSLRTKPGLTSMAELVRSALRLAPDRIVVGELRGAETLALLRAWGSGHPGGIATINARSAESALGRLLQFVQEPPAIAPRKLIADAIDVVVLIVGRGLHRRVERIVRITGLGAEGCRIESALHEHEEFRCGRGATTEGTAAELRA